MMEIGWSCYQINYTKEEEDRINSQRRLRERKIKERKSQVSRGKGPSKLNGNIASLDQSPPPRTSEGSGLKNPKASASQASPSVNTKRITKLKTRWDKSQEQYDILKNLFILIDMYEGKANRLINQIFFLELNRTGSLVFKTSLNTLLIKIPHTNGA